VFSHIFVSPLNGSRNNIKKLTNAQPHTLTHS